MLVLPAQPEEKPVQFRVGSTVRYCQAAALFAAVLGGVYMGNSTAAHIDPFYLQERVQVSDAAARAPREDLSAYPSNQPEYAYVGYATPAPEYPAYDYVEPYEPEPVAPVAIEPERVEPAYECIGCDEALRADEVAVAPVPHEPPSGCGADCAPGTEIEGAAVFDPLA